MALGIVKTGINELQQGSWSQNEVKNVERMLCRERLVHTRNPHERLMEALDAATLCQAYARPTSAIDPTVSLRQEDLIALARSAFGSERLTLVCLAPEGEHPENLRSIQPLPDDGHNPIVYPACERVVHRVRIESPDQEESFIRLDLPGFGMASEYASFNAAAASLLGGTIGILKEALDETGPGICYDVFADTAQFATFGQVSFGASCAPSDLEQVQNICLQVLSQLFQSPPVETTTWRRLEQLTQRDADILLRQPYDLFDFLVAETHPIGHKPIHPHVLMDPWHKKKEDAAFALRAIFDPRTVCVGIMK